MDFFRHYTTVSPAEKGETPAAGRKKPVANRKAHPL